MNNSLLQKKVQTTVQAQLTVNKATNEQRHGFNTKQSSINKSQLANLIKYMTNNMHTLVKDWVSKVVTGAVE